MGKEVLITNGSNPQPEIRKNAETASDWLYSEEATRLYNLAVIFRDRLVDPILRLDRNQVPDPVISFDNGAAEFHARCTECGNEFVQATAAREIVKNLDSVIPNLPPINYPHPLEPEQFEFDPDAEIDWKQDQDLINVEPDDMDGWEDLGMYLDRYANA